MTGPNPEGFLIVFRAKWTKKDTKTHPFANVDKIGVNLEGNLIGFREKQLEMKFLSNIL